MSGPFDKHLHDHVSHPAWVGTKCWDCRENDGQARSEKTGE